MVRTPCVVDPWMSVISGGMKMVRLAFMEYEGLKGLGCQKHHVMASMKLIKAHCNIRYLVSYGRDEVTVL